MVEFLNVVDLRSIAKIKPCKFYSFYEMDFVLYKSDFERYCTKLCNL